MLGSERERLNRQHCHWLKTDTWEIHKMKMIFKKLGSNTSLLVYC